jgi:hypothetical protein
VIITDFSILATHQRAARRVKVESLRIQGVAGATWLPEKGRSMTNPLGTGQAPQKAGVRRRSSG